VRRRLAVLDSDLEESLLLTALKNAGNCAVEGLLIVLTGASRRLLGRRDPFAER
jgi:hypothetical protein